MSSPTLQALGRALRFFALMPKLVFEMASHLLRRRARPDAAFFGRFLRRAFAELGVSYVKFGQFLAMRFDVLPFAVCRELALLLEDVPPMAFATVRRRVEAELGGPLEQVFARFDPAPLAAASIAQVHRARTPDGEDVAVKVQRPGIEAVFRADVRALRVVARAVDALGILPSASLTGAVDEFAAFTLREMDFVLEGKVADRLRGGAGPHEKVPRVVWRLSTPRVLTLELIEGVSLSTLARAREAGRPVAPLLAGVALEDAVDRFVRAALRQLFLDGFFHGDLHPGNLLIQPDGTVAFVDFGIFGALDDARRRHCAGYVGNIARRRFDRAFDHYLHLVELGPGADVAGFRRASVALMARWVRTARDPAAPIEARHMGTFWNDNFALFHRYGIRLDLEMTLFWRTLFLLDSTTLRLLPSFDLLGAVAEFFAARRPDALRELARGLETLPEAAAALRGLPAGLDGVRRRLAAGGELAARVERTPEARRAQRRETGIAALAAAGLGLVIAGAAAGLWGAAGGLLLLAATLGAIRG